ncbi:ABC transporter substrate-binding protein [Phytoactinopolyspora mesophila]|uniref:ABC transporter substrate-binding protein n=1 Tax=Phytoactinopolyspora mesophila TaxID=2650750 RepID=A0A7K3M098_9ACTN|nr:ABC transporter substrate-binding protein [Phytoactinopolyspora mesophila]NDL56694.1 ABC transporter substrate-binding protein [Phytoactinopolyspora mesophila]
MNNYAARYRRGITERTVVTSTRFRGRIVLAGVCALVLASCGGDGGGGAGGEAEQVFRYADGLFPVSLDTHQYPAEEAVQTAVQQVLEPLVRLEDGEPVPVLAQSWENTDETTWVFHLRDDVEFTDGSPLTADDVKASAERLIDMEGPLAPLWAPVESIEATDDSTVTFHTSQPLGTLPSTLSLLFIGPAGQIDDDAYWQQPVGTGPFTVDRFVPDDRVLLERNDGYWGDAAILDRVEIINIPEESSRITALHTGEIDAMSRIPPDQIGKVDGESGIVYETGPSFTYYFIWFNGHEEPLDDVRVRQAMWHAVNVEGVVADLFGDLATLAQAPITQAVFGAPALEHYAYDPGRARQLLAEAGYPDGIDLSIQWPREGGPNIRGLAQAFISDWADVGVNVEPLEKERAQWLEDFGNMNWDLNLQTNATGTGDADFTLGRLYTCEADRMGYCNEDLDDALARARASLDPAEREALYLEAARYIWDDAVGIFPADLANNTAYREHVQGFELPPNGRPDFSTVAITNPPSR